MKSAFKPTVSNHAGLGIVDIDVTQEQLAAIGHVAIAHNEVEERLYNLFGIAVGLERIGDMDGVASIIYRGAEECGLNAREMEALRETLGAGVFGLYKTCRDTLIHAKSFNTPAGNGFERRGCAQEVLMTAEALEALAAHLACLIDEIAYFDDIFVARSEVKGLDVDDPKREQIEEEAMAWYSRYRHCRNRRLSLPPLPEFCRNPN